MLKNDEANKVHIPPQKRNATLREQRKDQRLHKEEGQPKNERGQITYLAHDYKVITDCSFGSFQLKGRSLKMVLKTQVFKMLRFGQL